jgi:hypothetical protein
MKIKSILLFLFSLIVFFSCSQVDDDFGCPKGSASSKLSPIYYTVAFKVFKDNDILFEDNEVQISSEMTMDNGVLIPHFSQTLYWYDLGRLTDYLDSSVEIFGLTCADCDVYYPMIIGSSDPCGYGSFDFWVKDIYYLVNYPNQTTDTLMVRDLRTPEIHRDFYYFINGNQVYLDEEETSDGYTIPYLRLQQPE